MDIALTAQFYQNYFSSDSNNDAVEAIRSLLGLATGALLAAGQSFKLQKEELGKEFGDWLRSNEFVTSDASKLIKLFDYFGDNFDALSSVSPLQLLRLVTPNQMVSRDHLAGFIDECDEGGFVVTCADIDAVQKQHKIKPTPTIKSLAAQPSVVSVVSNVEVESKVNVGMVGNQQGGVGIFRLEVKDYQLANQLDTQWKESGFTANQWMRFMSSSVRVVQDIGMVVLGRTIADESQLDELIVAIKANLVEATPSDATTYLSQLDVVNSLDELPTAVIDCLKKINELNSTIASSTESFGMDAMMRRSERQDRDKLIVKLKMLAEEHELDFEALLLTITDSTKVPFIAR